VNLQSLLVQYKLIIILQGKMSFKWNSLFDKIIIQNCILHIKYLNEYAHQSSLISCPFIHPRYSVWENLFYILRCFTKEYMLHSRVYFESLIIAWCRPVQQFAYWRIWYNVITSMQNQERHCYLYKFRSLIRKIKGINDKNMKFM
jgi:hypothetical protein